MSKKKYNEVVKTEDIDSFKFAASDVARNEWWGAKLLAEQLLDYVNHSEFKKTFGKWSNIERFLNFLLKEKYNMMNFIYLGGQANPQFKILKKGKTVSELEPVKLDIAHPREKSARRYEIITEDEYKYRNLCAILLDGLGAAGDMISLMSGRDKNEVFTQLIVTANTEENRQMLIKILSEENK